MNYDQLKELRISEYEEKIRNNEQVSRFAVYPYRDELRELLKDDEKASEYLEQLVESALESL